jgi:3-hydroxyisobutyrate dehydrogenase-like beta-hydroxyacid dehydrogenase
VEVKMNVGFIGLGQMGRHMSKHVLDGGFDLTVYDIRKEAAAPLLEKGAKWANSPKEVAKSCQVVISSLPTPQDIEQMVNGINGLKAGWKAGDIYVDMSTNAPSTIRRIAEDAKTLGVAVLDAPVSGGTRGAEMGTLAIMVGGDLGALEKVRKVLETMGQKIFPMGAVGNGNVAKLINNMIALANGIVSAEGFVLGVKAGIDAQTLWDIISMSTGNSWSLQQYSSTVLKGNFAPMYRLSLALKDISLAIQLGKENGVPLPLGSAAEQKLIEAKAAGLGEKGIDAVILRLEELIGVQVRSNKS